MNISKMRIKGYRRFKDTTLTFCSEPTDKSGDAQRDHGTTVLVGSNNSGKTSIVELIHNMLDKRNQANVSTRFPFDDFNLDERKEWLEYCRNQINQFLLSNTSRHAPQEQVHLTDSDEQATGSEPDSPQKNDGDSHNDDTNDKSPEDELAAVIRNLLSGTDKPQQLDEEKDRQGIESPEVVADFTIDYTDQDDLSEIIVYLLSFEARPTSVNFRYVISADPSRIKNQDLDAKFRVSAKRIMQVKDDNEKTRNPTIDEVMIDIFMYCMVEDVYYCDPQFRDFIPIDSINAFKNLFNCHIISAKRNLDDTAGDHTHALSSKLINLVSNNPEWAEIMNNMRNQIMVIMHRLCYSQEIVEEAQKRLNPVIQQISSTNGGRADRLFLNGKITEDSIHQFLDASTVAEFGEEDSALGESSQGLGYSNLILIILEFLEFLETCKTSTGKVNCIIIEEPESHMHPQMQCVFIRYIFQEMDTYIAMCADGPADLYPPTCLITTHSTQIVRESSISQMRILRQTEAHLTDIINLIEELRIAENEPTGNNLQKPGSLDNKSNQTTDCDKDQTTSNTSGEATVNADAIRKPLGNSENNRRWYEILFDLNFADIVFADKVILFEGDTERMYLQALIRKVGVDDNQKQYSFLDNLRKQYISYVQVGGRHAFAYIRLLDILKIKSVIITDIDYSKSVYDRMRTANKTDHELEAANKDSNDVVNAVKQSEVTNPTINRLIHNGKTQGKKKKTLHVSDVYAAYENRSGIYEIPNCQVAVSCQTDKDGYARTLEEAMLCTLFQLDNVFVAKEKSYWRDKRDELMLGMSCEANMPFPIPKKSTSICIHDVVDSISNGGKTDFMYSIILSGKSLKAMPPYIEHSLRWLSQDTDCSKEG
ncbi:AAA family ATPase [Bifidobacterium favimelis]|uniref:AAA family ATPase n=1 Tax=Bifidobacterium favimelis TaxID=3122979 RepID=A0ABU8ZPU4_9BIFI